MAWGCSRDYCDSFIVNIKKLSAYKEEYMDVIIFGGQSNMQGQTECLPQENIPVQGAVEYRYNTNFCFVATSRRGRFARGKVVCGGSSGTWVSCSSFLSCLR